MVETITSAIELIVPHLADIIQAAGVIAAAWFVYNQSSHDAKNKLEMQRREAEIKELSKRRNHNVSQIYGLIWQLLHDLSADRVYIVQPHPLTHNEYLTIQLEVQRSGVSPMKENVQRLPMADVANFSADLSGREFMYYKDIETNVRDKRARAMLLNGGSHSAIIRRLATEEDGWVGNIFCEFNHTTTISPDYARGCLEKAAEQIQYILPPII